jgi:hypothetical protein
MQDASVALWAAGISSVTTLSAVWLKSYLEKRNVKIGNPYAYNDKYRQITEILEEIRTNCKATRVSLFEFHNGGKLYSGQSEQKLSMKAESYDPSFLGLIKEYQGIPVSIFDRNIRNLEKANFFVEHNEYSYNDTLGTLSRMAGVHMSVTFKIDSGYTSNNIPLPLAIITIGYNYPIVFGDREIEFVNQRLPLIKNEIVKVV